TYMGQTASDLSLAPPNGPLGAPQLALGRLPARNPAEASALVAKLAAYTATSHQWSAQLGLVADAAEAGSFDAASDRLATLRAGWSVNPIYESQYGAGTTQQIVDSLNAGQALLNYYGHASFTYWGEDQIFSTGLLGQLHNSGRETFVTSMSCYTGD